MDGHDVPLSGYIVSRDEPLGSAGATLNLDADGVIDMSQSVAQDFFNMDGDNQFEILPSSGDDTDSISNLGAHSLVRALAGEGSKERSGTQSSLSSIRIQTDKPRATTISATRLVAAPRSGAAAALDVGAGGEGSSTKTCYLSLGEESQGTGGATEGTSKYRLATGSNGKIYLMLDQQDEGGQSSEMMEDVQQLVLTTVDDDQAADLSQLPTRSEYRKMSHKEVERRRRDKINTWIGQLSKLVPGCDTDNMRAGESKCAVLSRVCEYVMELKTQNDELSEGLSETEKLNQETSQLREQCSRLRQENELLLSQLQAHGIPHVSPLTHGISLLSPSPAHLSPSLSIPLALITNPTSGSSQTLQHIVISNSFKQEL